MKMISILLSVVLTSGEIWICILINFSLRLSSLFFSLTHTDTHVHVFSLSFSSVLQVTMCYWFGIDSGVICCHLIKNSLAKLLDITTAGNVTFVNVFNHIFNKTADAHHKSHFLSLSGCVKSAHLKALAWAEALRVDHLTPEDTFWGSGILWQCWKQKDSCKNKQCKAAFFSKESTLKMWEMWLLGKALVSALWLCSSNLSSNDQWWPVVEQNLPASRSWVMSSSLCNS